MGSKALILEVHGLLRPLEHKRWVKHGALWVQTHPGSCRAPAETIVPSGACGRG